MEMVTAFTASHHQTVRLAGGRHRDAGQAVCVLELASMLAGESFTDRPRSVCPTVASILRAYNDVIDDARRQDLYRYASECVGTRGDYGLQHQRAAVALAWARPGHEARYRRWRWLAPRLPEPAPDDAPDRIAEYVVRSLGWCHAVSAHTAMLWLLDRLIAMGPAGFPVSECRAVEDWAPTGRRATALPRYGSNGGATPQPQRGTGAFCGTPAPGCELWSARREPHSA
jgi:hypothetical protein